MCYEDLRQLYAATAKERDELRRRVDLLEKEKAALLKILMEQSECEICKHNLPLPCGAEILAGECEDCTRPKTPCCGCGGIRWEWCGLEGEDA